MEIVQDGLATLLKGAGCVFLMKVISKSLFQNKANKDRWQRHSQILKLEANKIPYPPNPRRTELVRLEVLSILVTKPPHQPITETVASYLNLP